MYRVELKAFKISKLTNLMAHTFLMYRVELKASFSICQVLLYAPFLMYRVELKDTQIDQTQRNPPSS